MLSRFTLHRWLVPVLGALALFFGCRSSNSNGVPPPAAASVGAPSSSSAPGSALQAPPATPAAKPAGAVESQSKAQRIQQLYDKREVMIQMRDGVRLFTAIYTPKDHSKPVPILLKRSPYSCNPYGEDKFPETPGPTEVFTDRGYAFAIQDVRGCWMSEGEFVDMRPHLDQKRSSKDVDESSDCYDTVDWLVKNVANNNGKVGMWGISYPGFYASAGMIDAHPALAAVSPQAPIADWWYDDFHHHGALFLPHAFNFMSGFGKPRPAPTNERPSGFKHPTPDGYQFFLDLGPLSNVNEKYFHGDIAMWNDLIAHPNYDEYWQSRNLLPHLRHTAPASMIVGGWFDAEDLYGVLKTYKAIEAQNPGVANTLVMGPWSHGGWARSEGDQLGHARFGQKTGVFYRETIEPAFFDHYLKGVATFELPEAYVFDTGANEWRQFGNWPPADAIGRRWSLIRDPAGVDGRRRPRMYWELDTDKWSLGVDATMKQYESFISDPAHPVPFTESISVGMTKEYMTDDQRFASRRPDVITYDTTELKAPITIAGPIVANLSVSTSGTDSDWIIKLIDVFPDDAKDPQGADVLPAGQHMAGYQMLVRSEVLRGRYREDPSVPRAFQPDKPTAISLELLDVLHTFGTGHRIMVQIQSTWFPLVDRNPQKFVSSVYAANSDDFQPAEQRVYWADSYLLMPVLSAKQR